jgi:hypothetical protein
MADLSDVVSEHAVWRKSSRSASSNCVEVARIGGHFAVRDSKDRSDLILLFTRDEWDAFIFGARDGEFDLKSFP